MSLFGWKARKSPVRKTPPRIRPALEILEDRTVPAVFNVAAGDVSSLIADMAQANSNGQSNTINLTAGTYDLTTVNNNWYGPNGLPAITSNLTINGNGATLVRDSSLGLNTPFRFFYIAGSPASGQDPGNLTLQNLTLEGGIAQGGNSNTGGGGLGAGGAIFNQGNLTLNGVTATQNIALGGNSGTGSAGGGGGIGQDGQGDNGGGFGGAATGGSNSSGAGVLGGAGGTFGAGGTGSSIGNGGGGGIGGGGGDSTGGTGTAGAGGFGGGGGGSANLGGAGGFGGGGGASVSSGAGGTNGFGGGAGSNSAGGGGAALGGAIFNLYGTTTLINSTLATNLAQGGQGGTGAGNGSGYGGAIFNLDGNVTVISSTIAGNSTVGAANGGGALYNLALGTTPAGQAAQSVVTLTDSILANSIASNDLVNDQNNSTTNSATVNATAPNIVVAASTINGATTNGTPSTANPMLGLLLNNGGPTPTMPLLAGSGALGAGAAGTNVPTTDQRGVARGSVLDLGAFQATSAATTATATTTTVTASSTSTSSGLSVTLTATVATTGSVTPTGSVTFMDSTTGAALGSGTLSVVNGQAQATLTTTTLSAGTHSITATYQGVNGLASSTGSTSVVVGNSNALWLSQVYHDLLGRGLDSSGLAYWSSVLSSSSRSQVAFMITQTTEYRADKILAAFQKLLNRPADMGSLNYFLGLMGQGTTIEGVDAIIAGSDEYFQNRGGGTTAGFLTAVYQDFLNRPLDGAGQQIWTQFLATGQTRMQLVLSVLGTSEYRTYLVQNMYQTYLARQADANSLGAFVSYLTNGRGNDDLVSAALIGSQEYLTRAITAA